jgi:hypothetical protein
MTQARTPKSRALLSIFLALMLVCWDIPFGVLFVAWQDHNVVDVLWHSYHSGNVVDSMLPDIAYAAATTIDTTVNTTTARHQKSGKNIVCVSDQICYTFYINSDSDVEYQKSTDGGTTWPGTSTQIHAGTFQGVTIWYDGWTPGDTGTLVHMLYFTTSDDLIYAVFDTADDSFTANIIIDSAAVQGSLSSTNETAVVKSTNGTVFVGTVDETAPTGGGNFLYKCTGSCTTASNWIDAGVNPWTNTGDAIDNTHAFVMLPLSDTTAHDAGDIMLVSYDIADGTVEYQVYDDSADAWASDFTDIDSAIDSTTYRSALGGTVDPNTGDLYITFVDRPGTANTSEVRVWKYSSDTWSQLTDPWPNTTDSTSIVLDSNIGIDSNTDDIYVAYIRADTTATVNNVYYAVSHDDGSTWSADNLLSDGTPLDYRAISINAFSDARLYAVWNETTLDDWFGNTVADLFAWTQSAYRFFANDDSTDVGTPLAAQDTVATLSATGDAFRLRLLLHNTGRAPLSAENLTLQYAVKSGACDTGFSGETYADVTTSTPIAYNDNTTPADGDTITANVNGPTHGGDTISNQTYEEANPFSNDVGVVASGEDGKWDFSLKDNGAPASTSYCIRVVLSDGSQLLGYSVIPEIITAGSGADSLSFSLSHNAVGFGTLDKNTTRYATNDLAGTTTQTEAHTLTASTNASSGYSITVQGTTLTSGAHTIDALGATNTTPTTNTEQFGIRATVSGSGNGTVSAPYAASGFAFDTASFPDQIASDPDGDDVSNTYSIRYVGNIAGTTEAGNYTATLTYVVTAGF